MYVAVKCGVTTELDSCKIGGGFTIGCVNRWCVIDGEGRVIQRGYGNRLECVKR